VDIVHRFADALDADDFETLAELLEAQAVYDSSDAIVHGSAAIVDSFRKNSEWGHASLDGLEFRHEIDDEGAPMDVRFIDVARHNGEEIVIDHTMRVGLSPRGLIESLRLEYPPGEKERISEFFKRAGLSKEDR
jgi:hypothetical protein